MDANTDGEEELKRKLERLSKIFDFRKVLSVSTTPAEVAKYYAANKIAYSLVHSSTGLIHLGISRDLKYKEADLLEPARMVGKYIENTGAKRVLELATGRGPNSCFLAQKFPQVQFVGLDLPNGQVDMAIKRSKGVGNFTVCEGDYHNLSRFEQNSFDLVFIVEALCYSTHKWDVFKQVKRVLKPGGLFIVFDAYHRQKLETLDSSLLLVAKLIAKGMRVEEFEYYGDFKSYGEREGFKVIAEEDLTPYVMPTLERFERLAKMVLAVPFLPQILHKVVPEITTNNAISGYLMPDTVRLNLALYALTVFES